MLTRQNKKRKGRSNVMNRERTVTTLTEGPESTFLVPTSTEDPSSNILSSPFSVSSSAGGGPNMSPAAFQMGPGPYAAYPFANYMPPMPGSSFAPPHPPQQFFHNPQILPPSVPGNDLEVLEKLKESIKNGQHEFFRAVPQPATLASLYLGPKSLSQVPPHPEQVLEDQVPGLSHHALDTLRPHSDLAAGNNNGNTNGPPGLQNEPGRRLRTQSVSEVWDRKPHTQPPVSDSHASNNVLPASSLDSLSVTADLSFVTPQNVHSPVPGLRYNSPQRYDSSFGPAVSQPGSDLLGRQPADVKPSLAGGFSGSADGAPRSSNHDANGDGLRTGTGPSSHTKYESQTFGRTSSDKSLGGDSAGSRAASVPPAAKSTAYDGKDELRTGRESNWSYRNAPDDKPLRHDAERSGANGSFTRAPGETRFSSAVDNNARGPRDYRSYDRDKDRDRDYGRDRDKDREWDRDRDRDRRPDHTRSRDERRNDERPKFPDSRRPPYESRYGEGPRRYDPKPAGETSTGASRFGPPEDRAVPRTLGEERAIHRPPLPDDRRPAAPDPVRPPVDDRRAPPLRSFDDRRPPVPAAAAAAATTADRSVRPSDDRRPPVVPSTVGDRPARPAGDDRRPLLPPSDRMRAVDDRRPPASPPPGDRQAHIGDDRRHPAASLPAAADRQVRPSDDRRPPMPPPGMRPSPDDRRPPPQIAGSDRHVRPPGDDRRPPPPPMADERGVRPSVGPLADTPVSRPPTENSTARTQAHLEDRSAGAMVPLEDRISRPPALSLQERISASAGASSSRPDERAGLGPAPSSRVDDRLSRPTPASLEERLSHAPTASDDRRPPRTDDPLTRPPQSAIPPPSSAATRSVPSEDRNMLLAEPVRPPPSSHVERPRPADDRSRAPASDRFARPVSPAVSERGRPPPFRPASRASSVVREDSRPYKPRSPVRSPTRAERDFRPPYRPESDRYASERRPDLMDVDPPPSRFSDSRPPYRRPSPPSGEGYVPIADRPWFPPSDSYPGEPARRPPPDSHAWNERTYPNDWEPRAGRPWERSPREYSREHEGRFLDRDPVPNNGWETREERERRVSLGAAPAESPAPVPRTFESRPLSSRLTDGYPDERYGRDLERARYPPADPVPPPFSRVRPRSPSPLRRPGAVDDLRPPLKRAREDFSAGPSYYSPAPPTDSPRAGAPAGDYPPRLRTPPAGGGYYDDARAPVVPPYSAIQAPGPARERDYDARDRPADLGGYPPYERREPVGRMPPPRSPPPYRGGYGRDDRRYGGPPRP